MKVLFLSNTAGQGHHSTATAMMEILKAWGIDCRMLDTYAYVNPVLYKTIANGYLLTTSMTPVTYGRFYRLAELKNKNDSKHSITNAVNSIMAIKLKKYFKEFNPDVIVCTHIFSAEVVNVMKKNGQLDAVIIGIITDYTIHPFWQDVGSIDYFVTASELLTCQAVKKGIPKEKILPLGIPIRSKFSQKTGKTESREKLGIRTDIFTILLMGGSMGYGNLSDYISQIDRLDYEFQILAVCGNNVHARRRIEGMKTRKKVYVYGFVNNVDLMMDASDCIVTKPGGLTTSEALAKNLPILMINPIPGQEERNVEFMLNNGLAVNITNTFPIDEALYQLFLNPEKLRNMESNIRLVGKPNAARDLCDFIINLEADRQPS